jgi:fructose-1,6-bisphosphatase II
MTTIPDRDLALEIVRVTEMAALAAGRLVGVGDKIAADQAAVDAMRAMFDTVHMNGVVVIGEGEKDEAPMLFNGERIGDGSGPEVDIAVDPLEGTTLTAKGMPNALAVVAISEKGSMFDPGPCVYMEKLAGDATIGHLLSLDDPIEDVLARVAHARGVVVRDLMVVVLNRPRHEAMIERIRAAGARVRLISDGDVSGVLLAVMPDTGVDLLWGIGGTPEGVLSAAALRCIGGTLLGRLAPRDEAEAAVARAAGYDLDRVLTTDDLVASDDCFFAATGVTNGDLLRGVRYSAAGARTHSLVMRGRSGTVRWIEARHDRAKLRGVAGEQYG